MLYQFVFVSGVTDPFVIVKMPPRSVIPLQSAVLLRDLQIGSCVLTVELDDPAPDPLLCLCDFSTCYSPEVCKFIVCCVFTAASEGAR